MCILESKIIRNFINTIYLFGLNAKFEVRTLVLNYLENVFNYKLSENTRNILLNDVLSRDSINLFFRKYKYMLIEKDTVDDLEDIKSVYEVARESIENFNKLDIITEDDSISVLKSFELLQQAVNKNLVIANSIYGVIYSIGLFVDKDLNKANEYYKKNALWNNEFDILALIYNFNKMNKLDKSYYWSLIAFKMKYIEEVIEPDLSKQELKQIEKEVEKNIEVHKILGDDHANTQHNLFVYNPSLEKILYDNSFDITEKKQLLFSTEKIDYSRVSALVCENKKHEIGKTKYNFRVSEQEKVINALKTLVKKENNVPLIINCESKIIINLYSKFIDKYFKTSSIKELDASRCDYNSLARHYATNNFLYQTVTQNGTNDLVIKYHNLHELKENNISLFLSLLNPEEKYYIQDLRVSINKKNLINIIFVQDLHSIDSRILQISNIITLKKETDEEKKDIVKTKFLLELENKNISYQEEYEKYVDKITEYVSYDKIFEVINEIVSRVSFESEDVLLDIILNSKNSRTIGF